MEASLSSEQTEKIIQFQDLTGIENMTVCRDILQRHGWDLEVAVQDQFNMSEGRPSVFASENPPPNVVNDSVVQRVFSAPPSSYNRWGGRFGYLVSFLVQFCYSSLVSIVKFAFSIFFRENRRAVTDPVGDVLRFVAKYEETYGRQHPVFYQGSYSQAVSDSKRELRFLVVYLHRDDDQDCNDFCRNCLSDDSVKTFIDQSNMLFWGCNIGSGEGGRVVQTLKAGGYPFLGVIVLRDFRMTLVGRMEGPMSAQELLSRLQDVVELNESCLENARQDRIAREVAQSLRREQDEAYQESLRRDQEKERARKAELDRKRAEEEAVRQAILDLQKKKEEIQRRKVDLVSDVPNEPDSADPDSVSVVFKLPSGSRLERRFLYHHTLTDVFNFVFCHPQSPDSFQLTTNFPKRILPCDSQGTMTLKDAGLQRKEVLFVHDLDA